MPSEELTTIKFSNLEDPEKFSEAIQGPSFKFEDTINIVGEIYVKLSQVHDYVQQRIEFDRSVR